MFELNLNKAEELFSLNLNKTGFDLDNLPKLQVKLAIDRSGSMDSLYTNGFVDFMVNLFIPAGMKFDDNQSIDIGFFNEKFYLEKSATPDDFGTYMKQHGNIAIGGTSFLPIFESMYYKPSLLSKVLSLFGISFYKPIATYLTIITDGDSDDKPELIEFLQEADKSNTYVQFIGIGKGVNLSYLRKLSDKFSNVHSIHYTNPTEITVEQFYQDICHTEFLTWTKSL